MKSNTIPFSALVLCVFLFAAFFFGSWMAMAQPARPMTLKEAVETTLQKNPLAGRAKERIFEAESQIPTTRANLYPNLSLTARSDYLKDAASSGGARFGGEAFI